MRAKARLSLAAAIAFSLAACDKAPAPPPEVRPVRTVTVERHAAGETLSLTGQIRAQDEVNLAFRLDGRMIERQGQRWRQGHAGPGRRAARSAEPTERLALGAGQFLRRAGAVDPGAKHLRASAEAARARLHHARAIRSGAAGPANRAGAGRLGAGAVRIQRRTSSATPNLPPTPAASVTAIGAEPGEVVRAGQMIVKIARQGGRDAVFDVPAQAHPHRRRAIRWSRSR